MGERTSALEYPSWYPRVWVPIPGNPGVSVTLRLRSMVVDCSEMQAGWSISGVCSDSSIPQSLVKGVKDPLG